MTDEQTAAERLAKAVEKMEAATEQNAGGVGVALVELLGEDVPVNVWTVLGWEQRSQSPVST